jgi:signal transduction histidine kinase
VALALHNVELDSALRASLEEVRRYAGALAASRARIVATADAERRRIERDLHDGAQQNLVALAVGLRLARDMVGDDADGVRQALDTLTAEVRDIVQGLRDLAHGIYPPVLMESGLPDALRAAANRSPLTTSVDVRSVGRYSTEVEAAVYFCVLEALHNAAKHAAGAQVGILLDGTDSGVLRFEVNDDGPGFDPAAVSGGHGFVNMGDRVGAVGGTLWYEIGAWTRHPGTGSGPRCLTGGDDGFRLCASWPAAVGARRRSGPCLPWCSGWRAAYHWPPPALPSGLRGRCADSSPTTGWRTARS